MKRLPLIVIRLMLLLSLNCASWAQEPGNSEDTRFMETLRKRGDNDLAKAYLDRLKKSPSPNLAGELDLETAKTRLADASREVEAGKKLANLEEARLEFERFLAKNPNHPRTNEIQADLGLITMEQGRVQLNKMLSAESEEARRTEGEKARALFLQAEPRLRALAKELKQKLTSFPTPTTPEEKAARLKILADSQQADLNVGLNLFDQASCWHRNEGVEKIKLRSQKFEDAAKVLGQVAVGDQTLASTWVAKAYEGRSLFESGNTKKSHDFYEEILKAKANPNSKEAVRTARYFQILEMQEDSDKKNKPKERETAAAAWLKDYPKEATTHQGNGVKFYEGKALFELAASTPKTQTTVKEGYLAKARSRFSEIEKADSEFSELARRFKLDILREQGSFSKKIEELKSFEDCYVRAQFEVSEMNKEIKESKSESATKEIRNKHVTAVLAALERGLTLPDAKDKKLADVSNGKAILAYYYLAEKRYPDAIRHGETVAREDVKAAQAANAATYALQAYAQMIGGMETQLQKNAGALLDENGKTVDDATFSANLKSQQQKMIDFAQFVQRFWPREPAADLARHQTAILLFRDKGPVKDNGDPFLQGIGLLESISPAYPGLTQARHLLAVRCLEAEEKKLPPPPPQSGQPAMSWRQRGLSVWESIPEPVDADPSTNETFIKTRELLSSEWYKEKKFDKILEVTTPLLARLANLRVAENEEKNKELHEAYSRQLTLLQLFAKYGQADAAFQGGKFARVLEVVGPVVAEVKANKEHPLKSNMPLAQGLLSFALRSAINENKLEQARDAIRALQNISDGGSDGGPTLLRQLVVVINKQLEDLRAAKDPAKLKQATDNFVILIDDLTKDRKLTPELMLTLSKCYSNMDLHPRAIEILKQFPGPKEGDKEDEKLQHTKQLLQMQELRATKDFAAARALLNETLGKKDKPGWGARNLDVQIENVQLYLAEEDNSTAYSQATSLVKALGKNLVTADVSKRAAYFEVYYLMVLSQYRYGEKAKDATRKTKNITDAARLIEQLETRFPDFGDEASAQRFKDLLLNNPELKSTFEKVKQEKQPGK